MGFGLIFAGLIFFFNPCINMFDILPDAIGCILVSAGLYKLSDVEGRYNSAREISNRLIVIYVVKAVLWFILFSFWKDGFLPFTFIFSVIEIIMMVGLCSTLYGAIEYSANLHGSASAEKHLSYVNTVSKFTVIFMIIKNVLAFLPEAFELTRPSETDFSYVIEPKPVLADYKPYVIVFFTAIVLVLGIYYIWVNFRFFRGLWRDKEFSQTLKSIYNENITADSKLLPRRRFKRFFILCAIAAILTVDLTIDSVNFTPDIPAYLVLAAGAVCLYHKPEKTLIASIPLVAISAATTVFKVMTETGVNRIMGYSYFASRVRMVENGNAVILGGALITIEMILFVFVTKIAFSDAADYLDELRGGVLLESEHEEKRLSIAFPVVSASIIGVLSVFSYITPYIKAYYHYRYINDTLTSYGCEQLSKAWETVQGVCNVAIIPAILLMLLAVSITSRKVSLRV